MITAWFHPGRAAPGHSNKQTAPLCAAVSRQTRSNGSGGVARLACHPDRCALSQSATRPIAAALNARSERPSKTRPATNPGPASATACAAITIAAAPQKTTTRRAQPIKAASSNAPCRTGA